ncbi:hypothetical protein BT67DRAFT_436632 [Trichocladium antarcticum]|uniref:Uncharacterized protein n=1 Tax=Trichocladium antarcticum TaxID=1450529 RepID=A0AAN6UDW3_9PEZI|nr:hypothetical protein BT67DRAFT_436632 [Trichocladium antarcticum]
MALVKVKVKKCNPLSKESEQQIFGSKSSIRVRRAKMAGQSVLELEQKMQMTSGVFLLCGMARQGYSESLEQRISLHGLRTGNPLAFYVTTYKCRSNSNRRREDMTQSHGFHGGPPSQVVPTLHHYQEKLLYLHRRYVKWAYPKVIPRGQMLISTIFPIT